MDDNILLSGVKDKIEKSINEYGVTYTGFLDIRQRSLAERICRDYKDLSYYFYGGYEEAERTCLAILPDYAEVADYNPLAILRLKKYGKEKLSHRDYLGSVLGLGIKREVIGDILVREDGADIVVLKEMADFLLYNCSKAGRANLEAEIVSIKDILLPEILFLEKKDTVASLRLDNIIAAAFDLSRGKAVDAIRGGLVYINGIQSDKADKPIKEGDKLVLRGKGKVILSAIGHVTKKDRIFITIKKYI